MKKSLIIAGSIPTALLGLLFKDAVDTVFGSVGIVGWMLLVTGTVLWFTRKAAASGSSERHTRPRSGTMPLWKTRPSAGPLAESEWHGRLRH